MNILSFSHDANLMGAQRSLLALLSGLQSQGHLVHLVVPGEGDLAEVAHQKKIKTTLLYYPYPSSKPLKALNFLLKINKASRKIRALVEKVNPDILHFNTTACVAPAMALKKSDVKKIWHLRERAPARNIVSSWVLSWSDIAIANCQDTLSGYPSLKEKGQIALVYNGISTGKPSATEINGFREKLGWGKDKVVILFAGNLLPHKNPMAIVEAAKYFQNRNPDVHFCILGRGPLANDLREKRKTYGLERMVELPGFKENALEYIAAADIVAIPSLVEPFPRTGLEAMAMAKPVVGGNIGGMAEQIIHGETGYLFSLEKASEFHNFLEKLAAENILRQKMGTAGQARAHQEFSEEAYTGAFVKVCRKLLLNKEE